MVNSSYEKIELVAGREAYDLIKKEGFTPDLIKGVASAAGGPKWFTIYGLTKYIISELIPDDDIRRFFIGSSVGAWQMTAALTHNPAQAMERLRKSYGEHVYSNEPSSDEISIACRKIIDDMIGDQSTYIVSNRGKILNVITSRGLGGLASSKKAILAASFATAALANGINRSLMRPFVQRTIFSNHSILPFNKESDILPTEQYAVHQNNLSDVLTASGAIPFMMNPGKDIPGGPLGTYWDGGITDYHISLPYQFEEPGIIIHPHFGPNVLAGWFDKKLPWTRRALPENMSKVLLIHPSQKFIDSLPMGRITDLKDFFHFGERQEDRINYWATVCQRSEELAEELQFLVSSGRIVDRIRPY